MDRDRQSELMSAYLDGELTPSERAEAERLLESAPALRDELNDFARLSDLLRALPRESAPAELAAAIRHEAERKSLLGAETASVRRPWLREIVVAVSAMAATVLGMVLLPRDALERSSTVAVFPAPKAAFESDRLADHEVSGMGLREGFSPPPGQPAPGEFDALLKDAAPAAKDAPGSSSVAMSAAAPIVAAELGDTFAFPEQSQHGIRIGDVVPYFQNGVAVVEVTVVDLEPAGDKMAVLLNRNGLNALPESLAYQTKELAEDKIPAAPLRKLDRDQQLMLVYVDASRETVAQVLEEMAQEQMFAQAKLQPPVEAPEDAEVWAEMPTVLSDPVADTVEEKPPVNELPADQLLVNDAVVVSNNYTRQRQESLGLQAGRDGAQAGFAGKSSRRAGLGRSEVRTNLSSKMARNLTEWAAQAAGAPADAELAQNTLAAAFRKQSGAAILQWNAQNDELQNNTVMLEQRFAEDKQAEKAKTGVQSRKANDYAEDERLLEEPVAAKTVRLLVVLQTPPTAAGKP